MQPRVDDERQETMHALASVPHRVPKVEPARTAKLPMLAIVGVCIGLVAVIGLSVWPRGREAAAAPTTPLAQTVAPTVAPTSNPPTVTPSGPDIAPYVALIEGYIGGGRYREAVTTAEGALAISGLRESDRTVLTTYAVSAGLKELTTQPFVPLDRDGQQRMVDTYLALKERARGAGVAIDTPLQVASAAFASSQFPLARVALEEAVADGSFNPKTNRDLTRLYVSTLFGLGKWYTTAEQGTPLYEEGLRWLVTSDAIADEYKTGQSEAEALLVELGYPKRETWPPAMRSPLLP